MALKFLNKKGWHTGSLRNIENVWKAEQKHDTEQKKLEELRKQIQEERERNEFRLLQEQAGLTPQQERLDFLYESGLAVGKSSEGFKALQTPAPPPNAGPKPGSAAGTSGASSSNAAAPGALFEDKPQSANDAWRKLHSDPLLLIHQKEQEALARIKNNPVRMAMIRKSVEYEKDSGKKKDKPKKNHVRDKKSKDEKRSSKVKHSRGLSESEEESEENERRKEERGRYKHSSKTKNSMAYSDSEKDSEDRGRRKEQRSREEHSSKAKHARAHSASEEKNDEKLNRKGKRDRGDHSTSERNGRSHLSKHSLSRDSEYTRNKESSKDYENNRFGSKEKARDTKHTRSISENSGREIDNLSGRRPEIQESRERHEIQEPRERHAYGYNRRPPAPKISEEERAARLREMQLNAELHEEQRWKRLKKASEVDAQQAIKDKASSGQRTFLDDAQKSIYGAEKGGSSSIEESVRRRTFYLQGGTSTAETNGFRR